jgi:hypothetical protein
MSIHRRSVAVAVAACIALAGCASGTGAAGPKVSPSAAPVESPEPSAAPPEAAVLVIAGSEVRVLDESGTQVDSLPYTAEPSVATDFFSALFEAPPVMTSQKSDENCLPNASIATWGDGLAVSYGEVFLPEGQRYLVSGKAASVGGVSIETPSGVSVGEPVEPLQAAIPVEQRAQSITHAGVTYDFVSYDVAVGEWLPDSSPEYDLNPYWGASALAQNGSVTLLQAPVHFFNAC